MAKHIPEIVITGGPCGGKSEALKTIPKRLREIGYSVVIMQEVAGEIFSSIFPIGAEDIREFAKKYPEKYCAAEEQMFLEIMSKLERRRNFAKICGDGKTVILLDRGPMDTLAYMPKEKFFELVKRNSFNIFNARDSFDGVVHLVTAADGAEEFYRQTDVRIETPKQARFIDKKTQWAWVGAPHLRIIDNSTGFDGKMDRLFQAILRILGEPEPLEVERKFLLARKPDFRNVCLGRAELLSVEQIYLNDGASRIRKRSTVRHGRGRSQGDSVSYYRTRKSEVSPGVRREDEERISYYDYEHLKSFKDFHHRVVRKHRYCFVYKNQYFELDRFISPEWAKDMWILEVELLNIDDPVEPPSFLNVAKEVTDDPNFATYEIARRK